MIGKSSLFAVLAALGLLIAFVAFDVRIAIAQASSEKATAKKPSPGTVPASAENTGTLTGRFRYVGRPPEPKAIEINKDVGILGQYNIVDQSLVVGEDRGVANVFVWVRSADIPAPPPEKLEPITIEFKTGQFFPHAAAFQAPRELIGTVHESIAVVFNYAGQTDMFAMVCPAHDEITHRVQPEAMPVPLTDNIHPWAKGWLLPLKHPFCAVSDKDGKFRIENLPPGKWEFQVWQERTGYLETKDWPKGRFTMEIKPGENDLGEIKLPPAVFRNAAPADER